MFNELLGRGTRVGKIAVGYSNSKRKLMLMAQPDGSATGMDAEKIRTIFVHQAVDNAVFMDCSNSATLWFGGKFEIKPAQYKDEFLEVAVGFK